MEIAHRSAALTRLGTTHAEAIAPAARPDALARAPAQGLIEAFRKYFYLVEADTPDLIQMVHRIRYEVYCREFGYEREEDCPGQMERDEYDEQAHHGLLFHRPSGMAAGCVRMVKTVAANQHTGPLPLERFCGHALDPGVFDTRQVDRARLCEISRLAVLCSFRRRRHDEHKPISISEHLDLVASGRDSFPFIPVGLFLAATSMALNHGMQYSVVMMEPRLARMLRRFGLIFTQIGEVIDYHGPRAPFLITREQCLTNLNPEVYDLLLVIDQHLSKTAYDT